MRVSRKVVCKLLYPQPIMYAAPPCRKTRRIAVAITKVVVVVVVVVLQVVAASRCVAECPANFSTPGRSICKHPIKSTLKVEGFWLLDGINSQPIA